MAYHDDLLQLALDLVNGHPQKINQATLRRSVSTAYYALFHLLISETVANWGRDSSRNALGRMFDHGRMREVSARLLKPTLPQATSANLATIKSLMSVARVFVTLQRQRQSADYDNSVLWSQTDAKFDVQSCEKAFVTWKLIRNENIAQDYLVSLLIKPRD
jgi:uncharacterized protein (UPF0332 family)